ncbi:MAG: hypothetical protein IPL40_12085 [Proteobacteria bacterium]|nr:hypothetical protein [Pseudomonadota bacterium]
MRAPLSWGTLARAGASAVLLALGLGACGDQALPSLRASDGGHGGADAASRAADARLEDAGVRGGDGGADAAVGSASWRCSETRELLGWQLAADYCVVARATQPAAAAWAVGGQTLWALSPVEATPGRALLQQASWLPAGGLGALEPLGPLDRAPAWGQDELVFFGSYLALSARGSLAAGYTLGGGDGGVWLLVAAAPTLKLVAAAGNFDAAWLDDETLLVNGLGLAEVGGEQAVYVWREGKAAPLITELGSASSFLAVGRSVAYVGGAFGSFPNLINRVFAFERAALLEAVKAQRQLVASSAGRVVYEGDLGDLSVLGDELFLIDSAYDLQQGAVVARGVFRQPVRRAEAVLEALGRPVPVLSPGPGSLALPAGLTGDGSRLLLTLDRGDLGQELVLLQAR